MSAKMRRRHRHNRLKRIASERRELGMFWAHGRFPSWATSCAMCPCGARAFSGDPNDTLDDFYNQHAYCD
jgi:hypothetical protein